MLNVTARDLESMLAVIDKATGLHEEWHEQLARILICGLSPPEDEVEEDAHKKCMFGQWYYSPANAELRKLASFRKIEETHRMMHEEACKLCSSRRTRWAIPHWEYDVYADLASRFRSELIGLRQKISETLQKIDPLTGAFRGEYLIPDLEEAQSRGKDSGHAHSLLLIRFDLAAFNHVLGRDKGDDVLREAIRLIRSNLDPHDKVFRYAGAEFVVCLPGRDKHAVDELRIRLLDIVADVLATISEDPSVAPGVQSAVVELEPDVSVEHLLHQANLVASKARG